LDGFNVFKVKNSKKKSKTVPFLLLNLEIIILAKKNSQIEAKLIKYSKKKIKSSKNDMMDLKSKTALF
jgi:hypothetical protein